jgi:signal transduction histidine kinase
MRDLVALSALPAVWIGLSPQGIAESLADALVGTLRSTLAYVRLTSAPDGPAIEVARADRGPLAPERVRELRAALGPAIEGTRRGRVASVPDPDLGELVRTVGMPLGFAGDGGMVVCGAARADFATVGERLLLRVACNQAAVALEGARLYREARDAVRAREEFLSIAAHELRNPVATVKGNAELLRRWHRRGDLDGDRLERVLGAIEHGTGRLATLVDDLLDVSQLHSGRLQIAACPTDLVALLRAAAGHLATDERHRVRMDLGAARRVVLVDPDRMEQVLTNVLSNAVKYSPDGGEIALSLREVDGGVAIRVQDQGIGLPPDSLSTLFQPFSRAPNAVERQLPGLGLGLYICRQVAELHGGHIWAESEGEGCGTTVCVWIPDGSAVDSGPGDA